MMYAKFIDKNKIEYARDSIQVTITNLPSLLESGKTINDALGYYPVEYAQEPEYNAESEYLHAIYSFDGEKITVSYEVRELFI